MVSQEDVVILMLSKVSSQRGFLAFSKFLF
jgi:hypothetical protein